jgi:hypothetical protein
MTATKTAPGTATPVTSGAVADQAAPSRAATNPVTSEPDVVEPVTTEPDVDTPDVDATAQGEPDREILADFGTERAAAATTDTADTGTAVAKSAVAKSAVAKSAAAKSAAVDTGDTVARTAAPATDVHPDPVTEDAKTQDADADADNAITEDAETDDAVSGSAEACVAAPATGRPWAVPVEPLPHHEAAPAEADVEAEAGAALPAEVLATPDATVLRRREDERRHTRNFLLIFMSTVGVGLLAYAFWLGIWSWPFGTHRPGCVPGTPTPTAAPIGQTSVRVYNTTSRRGLALNVARDLQKRGFTVPMYDNDTATAGMKSAAEIRYGPEGLLNARTVKAQIVGNVVLVPDGTRQGPTVDLVLGGGFAKLRPPGDAAKLIATPTLVPEVCPSGTGGSAVGGPSTTSPRGTSQAVARPTTAPADRTLPPAG